MNRSNIKSPQCSLSEVEGRVVPRACPPTCVWTATVKQGAKV